MTEGTGDTFEAAVRDAMRQRWAQENYLEAKVRIHRIETWMDNQSYGIPRSLPIPRIRHRVLLADVYA